MVVVGRIGNCCHAFLLPQRLGFGFVALLKSIKPAWWLFRDAIECFQQVLDRRIVGCVTNKNYEVTCDCGAYEARCPTFCQIGASKLRTRQHEIAADGILVGFIEHAVKMYYAVKAFVTAKIGKLAWRPLRQFWRCFLE